MANTPLQQRIEEGVSEICRPPFKNNEDVVREVLQSIARESLESVLAELPQIETFYNVHMPVKDIRDIITKHINGLKGEKV